MLLVCKKYHVFCSAFDQLLSLLYKPHFLSLQSPCFILIDKLFMAPSLRKRDDLIQITFTREIVNNMNYFDPVQSNLIRKIKIFIPFVGIIIITGLQLLPAETIIEKPVVVIDNNINKVNTNNQNVDINYTSMGTMKASWYGPRFHGRLTANGEIYDQMALTAAHKSLPFGTLLKLTNPKTNKSIVVRINDRGPYIPGRQIDLSKKAALILGAYEKGVIKLKVEKVVINGLESSLLN